MPNRYFTVIDFPAPGQKYGRYKGKYPSNAASKAFSQLAKIINLKNSNKKNHMVFTIREITQGSDNKNWTYVGTRVELNQPIVKKIGNKTVKFNYKNIISQYEPT